MYSKMSCVNYKPVVVSEMNVVVLLVVVTGPSCVVCGGIIEIHGTVMFGDVAKWVEL